MPRLQHRASAIEPDGPSSRMWKALVVLMVLTLLSVFAFLMVEASCRSVDRQRFIRLYTGLANQAETFVESRDGNDTVEVILEDDGHLRVLGLVRSPSTASGRYPALLLLGGFRTGRRSIDYLPPTREVVLLAIDYPYEGKKSGLSAAEFIIALPAMRTAVLATVPAAMIAVDYLRSRPDVDPDRIVLVAGSVGALFAPAIAATDSRIAAVALLFGGGDIQSLLAVNARDDLGPLTRPAAWLGKVLTCPVEPLHHVGAISPRPVFLLNGSEDLGIPERNSRLLHLAANDPKTVRWIDTGHVVLQDRQFHDLVTRELVTWLGDQGLVSRDAWIETEPGAE